MVKYLYPYILECDFPIKDFMSKYISSIKEEFGKFWDKPNRKGNDMPILNEEVYSYVTTQITNIIFKEFNLNHDIMFNNPIRLYMQDNIRYQSNLHNHIHSPGNICSTFYLNIPKEGGEIMFSNSKLGGEVKIKPQIDKLYLFPIWLDHTPLPQLDKTPRLCFNWDYPGMERPFLKNINTLW